MWSKENGAMNKAALAVKTFLQFSLIFFLMGLSQLPAGDAKLVEGAKREGKLVWWGTLNLDVSKRMLDRFEKKYPFIKTELFRAGRGPLLNKVLAEAVAGRHVWDVLSGTGEMQPSLMERKLLGSYRSPERQKYEEGMQDAGGYWTAMYVNPYVLGYNTNLVKKESVPRTYADLLDSKWRDGKISVDSDAYPILSGLAKVWGREKAVRYLRDLAALEPSVKRGNAERVQLTAAGEYPLLIAYAPASQRGPVVCRLYIVERGAGDHP
jgi:iron(III) transport system substrate-binding protein